MSQGDHPYIAHVRGVEQRLGQERRPCDGRSEASSKLSAKLEYYLLRSLGLTTGHLVVDVGRGSLAQQLAPDETIRYIGTDVVPRLIQSAKTLTMRQELGIQRRRGYPHPAPITWPTLSHSSSFSPTQPRKKASNTFRRPHGVKGGWASNHFVSGVPDPMSLENFHAIS